VFGVATAVLWFAGTIAQNVLRSAELEAARKELEVDRKTLVDEFDAKLSELYNVCAHGSRLCYSLWSGRASRSQAYNALGDAQRKLAAERDGFDAAVVAFEQEKVGPPLVCTPTKPLRDLMHAVGILWFCFQEVCHGSRKVWIARIHSGNSGCISHWCQPAAACIIPVFLHGTRLGRAWK
jgi:hypothetical protein